MVEQFKFPKLPTTGAMANKRTPVATSQDLTALAHEVGLGEQADEINDNVGESSNEIFSGGMIMDFFDVLNSLQYGITGLLKGKSFSEGVRTRQSFSDKDALGDNGIPGVIAGVIADILVDPLTYIAPLTILKKVPGFTKGVEAFSDVFKISTKVGDKIVPKIAKGRIDRAGQWFTNKITGLIGADPVYGAMEAQRLAGIAKTNVGLKKIVKPFMYMDDEVASKFPDLFRRMPNGSLGLKDLSELPKLASGDQLKGLQELWKMTGQMQLDGVAAGVLKKGDDFYVLNQYMEHLVNGKKGLSGRSLRIMQKNRKLIYDTPDEIAKQVGDITANLVKKGKSPDEISKAVDKFVAKKLAKKKSIIKARSELGEITNSVRPLAEGIMKGYQNIENAKMMSKLAVSHGFDIGEEGVKEGYTAIGKVLKNATAQSGKITQGKDWGTLAGKQIPTYLYEHLVDEMKVQTPLGRLVQRAYGFFKWGKTAGNPSGQIRNVGSNKLLNWWKLGMNPLDPRAIKSEVEALGELKRGTGKWIKEIKPLGWNTNTFAGTELTMGFDDMMLEPLAKGLIPKVKRAMKKGMQKTTDLYQFSENEAKLTAYIYNRKVKGQSIEKAWSEALSATFDYNAVGPVIKQIRTNIFGVPFLTFGVKAAPLVAETALKHPGRISVIGKAKRAIENLSDINVTERERAAEPDWVKNGFFIKVPIKDKHERSVYFDMTYLLPFGDMVTGEFFRRKTDRQTGLNESVSDTVLSKSPVFNLIGELFRNEDFYGSKIWRSSDPFDSQVADMTRHIAKMWLPPLAAEALPGGHIAQGRNIGKRKPTNLQKVFGNVENSQQRTAAQEGLRHLGVKLLPVDVDIQESYSEYGKKRGLETLLREAGQLREFKRTYVPKKK